MKFSKAVSTYRFSSASFVAACLVGAMVPAAAFAEYPERRIRIVTPYDPGSMVDTTTRMIAEGLSEKLGQTVVVENRSGGMGIIAMNALLGAPADGYTLLTDTPASAINPTLYNADYNPKTEIAPIAQLMRLPFVIAANPQLNVKTAKELIELAKQKPDEINVGVAGTSTGLVGELFSIQNGIKMHSIPYKGAGAATMATLKGDTSVIFLDAANLAPHINDGKLNGLLVTGDARSPVLPQVQTAAEQGLEFDSATWFGLFARADVPAEIQEKLNETIREVMASPKLQSYLKTRGATASDMNAEQFRTFFHKEVDTWAQVIKQANIKVN